MYGSAAQDPAVRFYDVALAAGATADVAWFAQEAAACGSPVLDLGCGTGRISMELARRGLAVTAIDSSDGMLSLFRAKLASESKEVQSRLRILCQSMTDFHVGSRFACILCCDAFFHALSPLEEEACLRAVNRHLRKGGAFLFNIHNNPNPDFLAWASSPEASTLHERGRFKLPGTADTLVVQESLTHDPLNQRVHTRLHFTVTGPKGEMIEESDSSWTSRYLCRYEALHLLRLCGFSVEAELGGYNGEQVSVSGQLVLKARKIRTVAGTGGRPGRSK